MYPTEAHFSSFSVLEFVLPNPICDDVSLVVSRLAQISISCMQHVIVETRSPIWAGAEDSV